MYKYIFILCISSDIIKSRNQITHHNLCFNLFMLDNNSFDNQESDYQMKHHFLTF